MSVRIPDLQLLYGIPGARDHFERLVLALIQSVYVSARSIDTKQGDGGIDIYVGSFTEPIDVFQTKFFNEGIGASQKNQIRKSFSTCNNNASFTMRSWTLCLPRDMTIDETEWFDGWKAKNANIIESPWTAAKLESLLMKDENKGIKESFFKEEHLAQIRDIHAMVKKLSADQEQQTFTIAIKRLQPLRIAQFEGQYILCLKLHFEANNPGKIAIRNWDIKYGFRGSRVADDIVTTSDFPDVGNGSAYIVVDRTILPTLSKPGYFSFGVRLLTPLSPVRQLFGALEDLVVLITPITETHVGEPVEFRLLDHLNLFELQDAFTEL